MAAKFLSTQSPSLPAGSSSTEAVTSYGPTSATVAKQPTQGIKTTTEGSVSTDYSTETLKHETLQPSFDVEGSSSSQFAMQHATQALPSDSVTMATTSYTSETSQVTDQKTDSASVKMDTEKTVSSSLSVSSDTAVVSIATESSSVPKSVHPSKSIPSGVVGTKDPSTGGTDTKDDTVSSKYEPVVSDTVSPTVPQSAGQTVSVSLTPSVSASQETLGSSVKSPPATPDYAATSRDLFHTMTPSKTVFSSSVLDTMSLKTTPVASLTLTPSVKPMTTDSGGDSTPLFGGGPNDILLYVAVPLFGVGLLIFLIVCVVCIKRRKAKQKGSPVRHPVPDLWVNTNAEVPLTPIDHRRGINGGEVLVGHRNSALRKRKMPKAKDEGDHMTSSSQKEAELCHMTSIDQKEAAKNLVIKKGKRPVDRGLVVTDIEGKEVRLVGDDFSSNDEGVYDENDNKELRAGSRRVVEGGCVTYEALYDFPGELDTHLSLRQGDVVHVHRKEDNGWWRGTIGDRTGWFPNGYVQAVLHDYVDEENEVEPHNELNISSFMVKKQDDVNRHSLPTEDEIRSEPIYCKIQPKSRRKSEPKLEEKSPHKHAPNLSRENTPIPIDEGTRFIALYAYTAQLKWELTLEKGDILLGKEKDRNGWMHGVKESTGQEGWFPAVYVDEIIEKEEKSLPGDSDIKEAKPEPDPEAYQHLEVNTKQDNDKDWVGILHKAVHTFTGEKAGDLNFAEGDTVTVFQVLENGWWLGSKDDVVGWFPGSYVEMIGHHSPKPKDDAPVVSESPGGKETAVISEEKQPVKQPGKLRPVRKAPAPPDSSVSPTSESKIPKIARPNRTAPPPPATPSKESEKETNEHDHDPLYDVVGKKPFPSDSINNEQKADFGNKTDNESKSEIPVRLRRDKPKVPARYVKPKLVSVPRNSVNLSDFHFEKENSRTRIARPQAPPPPRPSPPQLISQDKLVSEKDSLHESKVSPIKDNLDHSLSDNEETESFFNVSPQRKFDNQLKRQDSGDPDDSQPYKTFSSFGSTFGKKESVLPNTSHPERSSKSPEMKTTGIPKLTRQAVVQDELSPTRNINIHKELEKTELANKQYKPDSPIQENISSISDNTYKDDSLLNDYDIIKTPDREENANLNECSSFLEINDTNISENQNDEEHVPKTAVPTVSKIPRLPGSENVSKIPMSHSVKQKMDSNVPKNALSHDSANAVPDKHVNEDHVKETEVNVHREENVLSTPLKHENIEDSEKVVNTVNDDISEIDRPRTNSMDKPPVAPKPKSSALPKVLPKPKAITPEKKGPDTVHDAEHHFSEDSIKSENIHKSPSPETVESQKTPQEHAKVSKIPQGSKIAQKSPGLKGKVSKIPASPKVGRKNVEMKEQPIEHNETDKESKNQEPIEAKSENVNLKQKPDSPAGARKIPRHRTFSNENPSLRNRSNSPRGRTGIPSPTVRSNSPASKISKPSGIPSPSGIPAVSPKQTALPKKQHKQDSIEKVEKSEPNSPVTPKPMNDITDAHSSDELESGEVRPSRPSKPPRVQKQKSADSKIPKHGKSLLPVIHKSMDGGSPSGGGSGKAKTGIPMAKPPRPPQPKSTGQHQENGANNKKTLYQAVKGYTAQCDGELTFSEGTFIKELSDCDRPGWFVGMLADGTTGIYPADHLKPSPVTAQSEA